MSASDSGSDASGGGPARPLAGFRIGVTASRRAEEQSALLERRGAEVVRAPALSEDPNWIDQDALKQATLGVLDQPIDIFVATTGIGLRAWFDAAEEWDLLDPLLAELGRAEILARGPKSVGALRRRGLRELWSPESEEFEDVLSHLRGRDLDGLRIVVQEHGQSLSTAAHALRRQGAEVTTVAVYRVEPSQDHEPMFDMIDQIIDRSLDAVTFTAAPAVSALMEAAVSAGHRDEVIAAFRADVVAASVGPVTAAAFEMWGVPSIYPERSRLAAMVKQLETELPSRGTGRPDGGVVGPRLITVAHGTRQAAGNRIAVELTRQAGERLGVSSVASYVELCDPLFEDVVAGLDAPAVAVPLLLSTGYHVRQDLPAMAQGATAPVRLGGAFGPHPLLAAAQVERLLEAGAERGAPVVLIAAGSKDPAAMDHLAQACDLLAEAWGAAVRLATLGGLGERPADVVRPGDVASPYLLSPGLFVDRARDESLEAGATTVADVLGVHPLVVDLVCERAAALGVEL